MAARKPSPDVQPEVVREFLAKTLPFSDLASKELDTLASQAVIDFQTKGTALLEHDKTIVEDLLVIQRGGVKLFLKGVEGEETLIDFRGEGGFVGELALIQNRRANIDAETVEDTFFIRIGKTKFLELLDNHPGVAQFFLRNFSDGYLDKAFSEMRHRGVGLSCDSGLSLFSSKVGDLVSREPIFTPMGSTIQMAAWTMAKQQVGSLLIQEPSGEIAGIVTDKDLRKAVALGMDYQAPIETIMSTPLVTIEPQAVCFDALLKMMTKQIHHLAVMNREQLKGIVTSHDIMVLQGRSPMSIFREIMTRKNIEGLYELGKKVPLVVRTLVEEGAKAGNITRMITVLNDLILERLLTLLIQELGPPPLPFCWMLMGSEGRKEQTFATDQDNALVYKDPSDEILARAADIYFTAFAEKAIGHLIKCGFPPCPGNIMASNPKWRQPFRIWRNSFERWIMVPEPEEVLNATIFFDFRPGFGNSELTDAMSAHIARHAPGQDVFLRQLASDCLGTKPPLSFFKNFVVEKSGEHKNRLDIKKRGLVPFVDFARVMALRHGIRETNTLSRLNLLREEGHIPKELYEDAHEAFEFLLQLRLVHQLQLVEENKRPDNFIKPSTLSELEKKTLKEAFSVIARIQAYLKDVFRLNIT